MKNIEPWCISRQIWWGHRIPAWYDQMNNIYVAENEKKALNLARKKILIKKLKLDKKQMFLIHGFRLRCGLLQL